MDWSQNLNARITRCRQCPRLVKWREEVARDKKREFCDWDYWGKPVPSFGDPNARLLVIGLAPAAHGGNRTGRIFTGDSSGSWLYRALHRAGFSNRPTSEHRNDGTKLTDCYITAACHCAPPDNKPLPVEIVNCNAFLREELDRLKRVRVVVALGKIGFDAYLAYLAEQGRPIRPKPAFGHGARAALGAGLPVLLGSYHPSRQNTNTGKLTPPMLESVFRDARSIIESGDAS